MNTKSVYVVERNIDGDGIRDARAVPVGKLIGRAMRGPYLPMGEAMDECERLNEAYHLGFADGRDEAVAALRDLLRVCTMPVNDHDEALAVIHERVGVMQRVNAILEKHSQ